MLRWGGSACSACLRVHHTQRGRARSRAGVSQPRARRQAADRAAGGGRAGGPHGRQDRGARPVTRRYAHMPFQMHWLLGPIWQPVSSLSRVKVQIDRPACPGHAPGSGATRAPSYQRHAGLTACSSQVMNLDLASLRSVRAFADSWRRRKAPLHVLINNAGIFSMGGASRGAVPPRHAALQEAAGGERCPSAA